MSRIDSSVHLASVPNLHNEYAQREVLDAGNDAVIADPVLPELAQRGAEGLSDAARGTRKSTWSSSIVHAIACHHVVERDGVRFSEPEVDQPLFGQVHVLKIV